MTRRPILMTLALAAAATVASGCGEESTRSGSTPKAGKSDAPASQADADADADADAASQEQLDDLVAATRSDFELLDDAYPEDAPEDDLAAIIDVFEDTLRNADGVEDVERVTPWDITEPLPCGDSDEPDHAVIAQGEEDFFIGRASNGWIAGFAEFASDDLGAVIARCEDGRSLELHLVGAPQSGPGGERVAAASFQKSTRELLDELPEQARRDPADDDMVLPRTWSPGDAIECASGDTARPVRNDEAATVRVRGLSTEDVVAIVTTGSDEQFVELVATCDDGTARDFRMAARPLDEAIEDAG